MSILGNYIRRKIDPLIKRMVTLEQKVITLESQKTSETPSDYEGIKFINLDYPTSSHNYPRWPVNSPHKQLEGIFIKNEERFLEYIVKLGKYRDNLLKVISYDFFKNGFFGSLDAVMLYFIISDFKPRKYIEVGSGFSTRFARQAIIDSQVECKLISIDPQPRSDINELCDKVIRESCESVDLAIFDQLDSGDILFIDNSHRSFMNSDVTIFFTEILPRLKQGVFVHLHDIALPYDYPAHWRLRFYNEQYLLASILLNSKEMNFDIIFPCSFVSHSEKCKALLDKIIPELNIGGGVSFWIMKS
ncbi:MAG: class I SAM-dependent methyltransferase [Deferribacteraceae bacterium]|jgi:hypothetical protein|nr:class I SAM-dependent methyltransferase [Deferribacteraceae bacterium]